ncbi:MAG: gamma-glutamyltransferase [Bacteroidota bacterium]|nr:gamma-glutamyltransferase [Bacteroidota bacterium]
MKSLKLVVGSVFLFLQCSSFNLYAASRAPVRAYHGIVVSDDPIAAHVGAEILQHGGNAVDAAVAVAFTMAVTYPEAGNIGGGGFMVVRLADGTTETIDFREKAPAAATQTMYLDEHGNFLPEKSTYGHLSCGVPGSVAGLLFALEKFGTMKREDILQPAITFAENGYMLTYEMAEKFKHVIPEFSKFPASMKQFTKNGVPYAEGDTFRQPDLAATLRRIQKEGRNGFYSGKTAEMIVAEMKRGARLPDGLISKEDLLNYQPVMREPVHGTYRGYGIISMGPSSSGGTALIQILNILEGYDLQSFRWHSAREVHVLAEAMRRVFADRAEFLGDADFVKVPLHWLLSKKYADERRATIDSVMASPSSSVSHGILPRDESNQTTHFSVVDKDGNCVGVTTTLNGLFGSKVVVDGAGFLLNNEMDDFSAKPGAPNMFGLVGGTANAIAPGKRMLSSMSPTIVLKEGKPFIVLGARGGSRIITSVAQVIVNVIDFGMNIQEAVDAPRIHLQWLPDTLFAEERGLSPDTAEKLQAMGYNLDTHSYSAIVNAILIDAQHRVLLGAPDARGGGEAAGY